MNINKPIYEFKPSRHRTNTPLTLRAEIIANHRRKRSANAQSSPQEIPSELGRNALTPSSHMKVLITQKQLLQEALKSHRNSRVKRSETVPGKPPLGKCREKNAATEETAVTSRESKKLLKPPKPSSLHEPPMLDATSSMSISDFTIGKILGQGAYAVVRTALYKPDQSRVALKTYDKAKLVDPQRKLSVNREIHILEKMNNQHIVKLLYKIHTQKELHLAMELVSGCSLHSYLKRRVNRRLPENDFKRLFIQILSAVSYCHSLNITHRDLKLENILVDESDNIKLIDFGFSTCFPSDRKSRMFCGTPSYMAPEIVARKECLGPPTDVWALGVLMFVLLCGQFPFKASNDRELFRKIQTGQFVVPSYIPTGAKILIHKILRVDPRNRVTVNDILQDKWINSAANEGELNETPNELGTLKGCSINGDRIDMNIWCSIKKLGYTDSQLRTDLMDKNSRASKLYNHLKSKKSITNHYSAAFKCY